MHLDKYAHLKSMNYIALDKILNQKVVSASKLCLIVDAIFTKRCFDKVRKCLTIWNLAIFHL